MEDQKNEYGIIKLTNSKKPFKIRYTKTDKTLIFEDKTNAKIMFGKNKDDSEITISF